MQLRDGCLKPMFQIFVAAPPQAAPLVNVLHACMHGLCAMLLLITQSAVPISFLPPSLFPSPSLPNRIRKRTCC